VRGGVWGVRVNQASPGDERVWEAIVRLEQGLDYILRRIIDMTATQSEFDQAFTDLSSAVGTLITDFTDLNTRIQSLPPSEPTPAQLQEIKDLSAKVHASLPAEAPVSPPPPVVSSPTTPPPVVSSPTTTPPPVVSSPPTTPPPVVDAPPPTPPPVVDAPPPTPPVAVPVTPPADAPGTVTPQAL